jgi:hypothetical protein
MHALISKCHSAEFSIFMVDLGVFNVSVELPGRTDICFNFSKHLIKHDLLFLATSYKDPLESKT